LPRTDREGARRDRRPPITPNHIRSIYSEHRLTKALDRLELQGDVVLARRIRKKLNDPVVSYGCLHTLAACVLGHRSWRDSEGRPGDLRIAKETELRDLELGHVRDDILTHQCGFNYQDAQIKREFREAAAYLLQVAADLRSRKVDQRLLASKGRGQINNAANARAKRLAKFQERAVGGAKFVRDRIEQGDKKEYAVKKAANQFAVRERTVWRWLEAAKQPKKSD
jgi:hypothetical protein